MLWSITTVEFGPGVLCGPEENKMLQASKTSFLGSICGSGLLDLEFKNLKPSSDLFC